MARVNQPRPPSRAATVELWLVNIGFGTLVGTSFLAHVPLGQSPEAWLFASAALISTVATLTAVPGLLMLLCGHAAPSMRWLGWLQCAVWALFQVLLFTDTRIYNLFGYHLGAQVWDLVYTRGSRDTVRLGWDVWLAVGGGFALVTACEHWVWRRCLRRASATTEAPRRLRPGLAWVALLAGAILAEKALYARADLARDRRITALTKLFPLYPRLSVEELTGAPTDVPGTGVPRIELDGLALAYPEGLPPIDPGGRRPDLLIAVVDCWRADALAEDVTPNLTRFAQGARSFADHLSGGNATRFGLFSLLYGIHGSYWAPVLEARRSPLLVDALLALGYDVGVFSSASTDYPELRSTAWVRVPGCVHDEWPAEEPWRRDELAAEACARWIAERTAAEGERRPYFAFLMLDSPHQTFSHPPDRAPFQPSALELSYMQLSAGAETDPELLLALANRYKNAVHHADAVAGRLLEELERTGALREAVALVTGDHGEEFRENGHFGHTSNFTAEQIAVPLLLRGPGIAPGVERRPTSHLDVPCTLLELLGMDPAARAAWTLGANLLDPPRERDRVVAGWGQVGLWTADGILVVPLYRASAFDVEVYDYRWRQVHEDQPIVDRQAAALARLADECTRFLVPAPPLLAHH